MMRHRNCAAPVAAMVVGWITVTPSIAHQSNELRSYEILSSIKGRVCVTKGGARFTFTRSGHYAYDGMWTDKGHYSVHDGAVTILLDSGLERDFAVSRRDGILYLEQTAVHCGLTDEAWP
jgi:hypothetical protein